MAQYGWFRPIEAMFYDALNHHDLPEWFIEPMPNSVNTHRAALVQGRERGWPFRVHNGRGRFACHSCGEVWTSGYTTVVWRARPSIGTVQIRIEKQGCETCETMCQGHLANNDQIGSAIYWMIKWMLDGFRNIRYENDGHNEYRRHQGPHDDERCEAGIKGTCRRCAIRQRD